jgi:DNA helicase-2/ATP-dependent DNA helicase PcrA
VIGTCKALLGNCGTGNLAVIGDPTNIYARTSLAQKLAKAGFSNLEPINCTRLYSFAQKIEAASGFDRLEKTIDFVCACMTGADKTGFLNAVRARDNGKTLGTAKFGELITAGLAVVQGVEAGSLLRLLLGFRSKPYTYIFCRDMFFAMCSALHTKIARPQISLTDAIWEVQNRIRHSGRKLPRRSIGSTLLLKGLEFDHSVIVEATTMNRKDWYVALTRATTSVTVLSSEEYFSVDP